MKKLLLISLAILLTGAGKSLAADNQTTTFPEKYGILLDRSLFSRTRIVRSRTFATTNPTLRPAQTMVLTGVVRLNQNSGFVAIIEDLGNGTTLRLHLGDSLAQGKLMLIGLDFIEYAAMGHSTRVAVGNNLEGMIADPNSIPTTGPSTNPSAGTSSDGTSGGDVLERMRQRRIQEMKR